MPPVLCLKAIRPALASLLSLFLVALPVSLDAQQNTSPTATKQPAAAQNAEAGKADSVQTPIPPRPGTLVDGTPIKLRLAENLSSADATTGQSVAFEVLEDVSVDGLVVIAKGSNALGTVVMAQPKRRMGRAGVLDVNIDSVRLIDNEKVALRAVKDGKGGSHVGAMTGAIVATTIAFFPAAPLFLFMKGKDINIPKGTEITAFIDGDAKLNMASLNYAAHPSAEAAAAAATQSSLLVESMPINADIEVDGVFVGNTPSTLQVPAGMHEVVLRKKGFNDWSRKVNVSGVTAHLSAELEVKAPEAKAPAAQ